MVALGDGNEDGTKWGDWRAMSINYAHKEKTWREGEEDSNRGFLAGVPGASDAIHGYVPPPPSLLG